MTTCYKQIQLTNSALSSVPVDAFIPYGKVTRRINAPYNCSNTFTVVSSESDTVNINSPGFYKITYSLTATAAAAGVVTVDLVIGGTSVYSVSQTIVDETTGVNLTLPYTIRVSPNCNVTTTDLPVTVQIQNTGVALTGGSSNMIIEKI